MGENQVLVATAGIKCPHLGVRKLSGRLENTSSC